MAALLPPANFGMIEPRLYRSGTPHELNYPFLETLHLKTIIHLSSDDPDPHLYVVLAPSSHP
jgi:tyrosine-protein phosphatase OCA1